MRQVEHDLTLRREEFIEEYEANLAGEAQSLNQDQLVPTISAASKDFSPYHNAEYIEQMVQEWAESLGIWDPIKGPAYNTMFSFLHPGKKDQKVPKINEKYLIFSGKVYAYLYYDDDRIGNDTQTNAGINTDTLFTAAAKERIIQGVRAILSALIQQTYNEHTVNNLSNKIINLQKEEKEELKKHAAALHDLFNELKTFDVPQGWRDSFFTALEDHILAGTSNHDTVIDKNEIWSLFKYMKLREEVSGMNVAELLMQLCAENFEANHVDFLEKTIFNLEDLLQETITIGETTFAFQDVVDILRQLFESIEGKTDNWLFETLDGILTDKKISAKKFLELKSFLDLSGAAEWNDVMSLWKEVLEEGSIFNLVAVAYLINESLTVIDSIRVVSQIIDEKFKLAKLLDHFLEKLQIEANTNNDIESEYQAGMLFLTGMFWGLIKGSEGGRSWQDSKFGKYRYSSPKSYIAPKK
jgi:hypothetical protein